MAALAAGSGAVAILAGITNLRETRRIERSGIKAWALVKRQPGMRDDEPWPPRPLLQFTMEDDRILEIVSPIPGTRRRPLRDGDTLLITYDPADPRTVVVHRRERRKLDYGFIIAGTIVVAVALALIGFTGR